MSVPFKCSTGVVSGPLTKIVRSVRFIAFDFIPRREKSNSLAWAAAMSLLPARVGVSDGNPLSVVPVSGRRGLLTRPKHCRELISGGYYYCFCPGQFGKIFCIYGIDMLNPAYGFNNVLS